MEVPFCPNCGIKSVEPVAANYDYVCPACKNQFNVIKKTGIKQKCTENEKLVKTEFHNF
ncbi:MAG: hypothetical protein GKS07_06020 [Nitrosopumilus sp.]|nr:MAG: hypothetical protein GKS07_06020 [Nitrosopumilus sp.]